MSTSVLDLFEKASGLSESDRALLAGLLIESLDVEPDEDVEQAWLMEVERRLAELKSGSVKTLSWEEVKTRLIYHVQASVVEVIAFAHHKRKPGYWESRVWGE